MSTTQAVGLTRGPRLSRLAGIDREIPERITVSLFRLRTLSHRVRRDNDTGRAGRPVVA